MIRIRSVFLIILLGCAAAYFIGYQSGYLTAQNTRAIEGMRKWVDETASIDNRPMPMTSGDSNPSSGPDANGK
jgi:hypothetical protein